MPRGTTGYEYRDSMNKTAAQRLMSNGIAKNRLLLNARDTEQKAHCNGKQVITRQATGTGTYKIIKLSV